MSSTARTTPSPSASGTTISLRHHKCGALLPCRAAHAASQRDAVARHGALKRAQHQFAVTHQIESHPKITVAHHLAQQRRGVRQHTHLFALALDERRQLRQQRLVLLFLAIHAAKINEKMRHKATSHHTFLHAPNNTRPQKTCHTPTKGTKWNNRTPPPGCIFVV